MAVNKKNIMTRYFFVVLVMGFYQVEGEALSIGTYCDYENLFFENVSPSLDGMLFHKLYLAGVNT